MPGPGNILIKVGAQTGEAVRELGNLNGPLSDVQSRSEKMGNGIKRAALPAVAALGLLAAAGGAAAKAAAEDAAEQDALSGALTRVAGATSAQVAAAETYISALSRTTGVTDSMMRPALTRLATATGDVKTAQDGLALALDISAQTGKSLDTVSAALAKGYGGNTTALGKLVPGLDAATLKSKDMTAITGELAELTGGAAAAAAQTATGKYKVMQVQMGELQEKIGAALIPIMVKMGAIMQELIDFASKHTTAVKALAAIIAVMAAGIIAANAAMKAAAAAQVIAKAATAAYTAVQWLFNAAMSANPIGLVIIAVGALAFGLAALYLKSETFRNAVKTLWDVLKLTNPLVALVTHFDKVSAAVSAVVGWISRIHFPSPPAWFGKIGGLFGGGGGPSGAAPRALAARSLAPAGARGASAPRGLLAGAGGGSITINVHGALDPEGTARAVARVLAGHRRRHGGLA